MHDKYNSLPSFLRCFNACSFSNYFWKLKYIHDYNYSYNKDIYNFYNDIEFDDWNKKYLKFRPRCKCSGTVLFLRDNIKRISKDVSSENYFSETAKIAGKEWKRLKLEMRQLYCQRAETNNEHILKETDIYNHNKKFIDNMVFDSDSDDIFDSISIEE